MLTPYQQGKYVANGYPGCGVHLTHNLNPNVTSKKAAHPSPHKTEYNMTRIEDEACLLPLLCIHCNPHTHIHNPRCPAGKVARWLGRPLQHDKNRETRFLLPLPSLVR